MTVDINISNYGMTPDRLFAGTKYSTQVFSLHFVFDETWSELSTRRVTFFPPRKKPVVVIIPDDGNIALPNEVTERNCECPFVVSGVNGTKQIVTLRGIATIEFTENPNGIASQAPTPSEIAQVYEYMQEAIEAAEGAIITPATRDTLGGVIVGDGLDVAEDGTLDLDATEFAEITNLEIEQIITSIGGI